MRLFEDINIIHETPRAINKDEAPYQIIIINGEYWGQRHHVPGSPFAWYVATSPDALMWDGQSEYVQGQTVLGIYVDESDYDLTVRQLYILTRGAQPPF